MPVYDAPLRDISFHFHEVLQVGRFANLAPYADADPETMDAILNEVGKFAREVLQPLNRVGDMQGCTRQEDGSVTTPAGFKDAYTQFCDNGLHSIAKDKAYGGQGLPHLLNMAVGEICAGANFAFSLYPGLTNGAWNAIHTSGSDPVKDMFLPKLTTGEWAGTMNMTEPQAGTDMGLVRTKAVAQPDDSYKITGQKIWISSGEHDLTDNIVHLVLARTDAAPEGMKGVSLFAVPKFEVKPDGSLGAPNGVSCSGLEDKMGIHGNSTCFMHFENATGYLIGEENKGMRAMFVMMNEERLGAGMMGYAIGEASYQNAVAFARDRRQGRALRGAKEPDQIGDGILVHPDVRRMLLDMRCFNESARALGYWLGLHQDLEAHGPDEETREKAEDFLALLTPVIKAYFTEKGLNATVWGQQVLGGAGYCEETGMSQFMRDLRITSIFEGTNGVQALDLVGRKLTAKKGRHWGSYLAELNQVIERHEGERALRDYVKALTGLKQKLNDATQWVMVNGVQDPNKAASVSYDYLHLFGLTALTHMWVLMADAANKKARDDREFYTAKLALGKYFLERWVPEGDALLARIYAGSKPIMGFKEDAF